MSKKFVLNRLQLVNVSVNIAFILGILMSLNLWIVTRNYPLTPISPLLPVLKTPADYILLVGLLISLTMTIVLFNSKYLLLTSTLIIGFLFLSDQSRMQPWAYQYLLILCVLCFKSWFSKIPSSYATYILQFLIISIYVWSGIHKINPFFGNYILTNLVKPFPLLSTFINSHLLVLEVLIPLTEILIGVLLLVSRTRPLGVILALAMHLSILFSLGPVGNNINNIIWPWNIEMMILVLALFYKQKTVSFKEIVNYIDPRKKYYLFKLVLLICGLLPLFNIFNYWDSYLSFNLYSGNLNKSYIGINKEQFQAIPADIKPFFLYNGNTYLLNSDRWSHSELNVPVYKELRVYKQLFALICNFLPEKSEAYLRFYPKSSVTYKKPTYSLYECPTTK